MDTITILLLNRLLTTYEIFDANNTMLSALLALCICSFLVDLQYHACLKFMTIYFLELVLFVEFLIQYANFTLVYSCSSLGQNLKTSTFVWEICFAVFISISGLVLFSFLIGNMQVSDFLSIQKLLNLLIVIICV